MNRPRTPIDFEALFGLHEERSVPPPGVPPSPRGRGFGMTMLALLALVLLGGVVVELMTEWLWFASLGQAAVMRTRLLAPVTVFAAAAAVGAVWLLVNWWWAARAVGTESAYPGQRALLPVGRPLRRLVTLAAVGLAGLLALEPAARWTTVALFARRGDFGLSDPLLGMDVGFYAFVLPMLQLVVGMLWAWVIMALVGAVALYSAAGLVDLRHGRLHVPARARAHVLALMAVGGLVAAAHWWLARYALLFAEHPGGVFAGPGFTDVRVRLPAYAAMSVAAIALAVVMLVAARGRRWRLPAVALASVFVLWLGLIQVLPGLVQRFGVSPDELSREREYLVHNIAATRAAFGLEDVTETEYDPTADITAELLAKHLGTAGKLRLWDWQALLAAYAQLQQFRTYYRFQDVDIDRYPVDGGDQQVMLSVRELDPSGLRNPTWVNRHLEFTHGFGAVVSPADAVDARGQPVFWMKDVPPVTSSAFGLELAEPRIYFGEAAGDEYVIVGTGLQEMDYPAGDANMRTTYQGADGVGVGSLWRRLLFAVRFGDIEILLSDALTADSRLLMHRNIVARLERLAPFLTFDPDPYAVITPEGRLVWMVDAYTTLERYPYGRRLSGTDPELAPFLGESYVRNSVKVVLDAYDGRADLYVVDSTDPVVAAWSRIYPGLFRAGEAMPEGLKAHWRYPEGLFRAQAEIYLRYHMTEPDVFYNAEDIWAVPTQTRGQGETVPVEPYYVTLTLRGAKEPELVLMQPFTPVDRPVMIGWLAARSDPGHYGELVAYRFSKGQQVDGPQLVDSRIDNDTEISAQLTLWSQSGSRTFRGNLLVYPVEDAVLYVEPLFLQAQNGAFPELKRVIVATKDRVVMRPTMAEALAALVGEESAATAARDREPGAAGAAADSGAGGAGVGSATAPDAEMRAAAQEGATTVEALVAAAQASEADARAAAAAGDWATFGRAMAGLQDALARLGALAGTGPVPAPAPPLELAATPTPAGDGR